MQIVIESTNLELWTLCYSNDKNDKGEEVDKPKDQYISADWENISKTQKLNIFFIVV